MKRLDWTLIRPPRPPRKNLPLKRQQRRIEEIEAAIDARVRAASERVLSEDEVEQLADLEERLDDLTIASCEAAHAPRVRDDPDWEHRLVDEYADADTDDELEEYIALRRDEFDCERCPHASPYSLYPQDPCEISVGPLLSALVADELVAAIGATMGPEDMRRTADMLERALDGGGYKTLPEVDAADLLHRAIDYLRFWSKLGFGVRPELVDDEAPLQTPDGPAAGAGPNNLLH